MLIFNCTKSGNLQTLGSDDAQASDGIALSSWLDPGAGLVKLNKAGKDKGAA
jgi:hypothetical protein